MQSAAVLSIDKPSLFLCVTLYTHEDVEEIKRKKKEEEEEEKSKKGEGGGKKRRIGGARGKQKFN